jgi:hypothetical protein
MPHTERHEAAPKIGVRLEADGPHATCLSLAPGMAAATAEDEPAFCLKRWHSMPP